MKMAIDSIEKIKKDIKERIDIRYSDSFEFYHGYICACLMADIIKSIKEYNELIDWMKTTLDLKKGSK